VENLCCDLEETSNKLDWSPETADAFGKIRHLLLNAANDVQRLPNSLYYQNVPCNNMNISEMLAQLINRQ